MAKSSERLTSEPSTKSAIVCRFGRPLFTLGGQNFLKTNFDRFLLSVEPYDREQHQEFYELIRYQLRVEIWYDSLYGGEQFRAVYLNVPRDQEQQRKGDHRLQVPHALVWLVPVAVVVITLIRHLISRGRGSFPSYR
jgi:hypothetical protein